MSFEGHPCAFGASVALLFGILIFGSANAADISGTWQGKINSQYVLKISKAPGGGYHGKLAHPWSRAARRPATGDTTSAIVLDGSNVKFTLDQTLDNFSGTKDAGRQVP